VTSASNDKRARLLELLRIHSFARRKVTLASGRESDFFIDCKQTVLLAEGHALVGALMLEEALTFGAPVAVCGVELGGCPLASAVALVSFQKGTTLDAVYVRKAAKDHGSQRLTEGDAHLPRQSRVVVLEDVITTGASTLKALDRLAECGLHVIGVIALVDRLQGGREAIEARVPVRAVFSRNDFMSD
jgi:orotate phosphoribosyltransferase